MNLLTIIKKYIKDISNNKKEKEYKIHKQVPISTMCIDCKYLILEDKENVTPKCKKYNQATIAAEDICKKDDGKELIDKSFITCEYRLKNKTCILQLEGDNCCYDKDNLTDCLLYKRFKTGEKMNYIGRLK